MPPSTPSTNTMTPNQPKYRIVIHDEFTRCDVTTPLIRDGEPVISNVAGQIWVIVASFPWNRDIPKHQAREMAYDVADMLNGRND